MAIYRTIPTTFWEDTKVADDFTPEDKYFMLYCLTNSHTNLCGCYEISLRQMSIDLGYNKEAVEKLLKRFSKTHKVLYYNFENKELFIKNWSKYNWTKSEKLNKPLLNEIKNIKSEEFKSILADKYNERDTVSIPYEYGIDTTCIDTTDTVSVTVTDTVSDTVSNIEEDLENLLPKQPKNTKHKYGEYKNVLLTDEELEKLKNEYTNYEELIKYLDEYIEMKGYKAKSHYLCIKKWVIDAVKRNNFKEEPKQNKNGNIFFDILREEGKM